MPPVALRWVLLRHPLGEFEPQALLCTDPQQEPVWIVESFVLRWQLEVTFEEVRAHLGVETQRQWSDPAIQRTTPALFGLFSLVALLTQQLRPQQPQQEVPVRQAAWYTKEQPTFAEALALVRRELWPVPVFSTSPQPTGMVEISQALYARFLDTLAYAA